MEWKHFLVDLVLVEQTLLSKVNYKNEKAHQEDAWRQVNNKHTRQSHFYKKETALKIGEKIFVI